MASHKSPLRDRLLSNSPDPIKSSILRESGMGWNSPPTKSLQASGSTDSITSPLRIAKRDSPSRPKVPPVGLARRTSSSYRHVHTNNLVSKSPFKSQIPTSLTSTARPSSVSFPTRRVSGEKRSRPSSMYDQAEVENDRPLALKRDRKQSKAFQGLLEKEPVSKSPFKTQTLPQPPPPPPPAPIVITKVAPSLPILPVSNAANDTPPLSNTPPSSSHMSAPPVAPSSGPSPGRSSLVSRRMHGPRLSGGSKRERRKTVTFHERCDVLEFDRDETEEEVFESASEDGQEDSSRGPQAVFSETSSHPEVTMEDDASYESVSLSEDGFNPPGPSLLSDPDASITGIVEEMFFNSNAANLLSEISMSSTNMSTPPRHSDIPTDLETEDGVPFGRSHHIDRFLQHHHQHSPQFPLPPPHFSPRNSPAQAAHTSSPSYPQTFNLPTHASPHGPPATPPRRSPAIHQSTPPLGRSTHVERFRKAREEEREHEIDADEVGKLPPSPSPMKKKSPGHTFHEESLIPRFDLDTGKYTQSRNLASS